MSPREHAVSTRGRGAKATRPSDSYVPLAQTITASLRDAIYEGRLEPGVRVGQEALAKEFGTSRIPVREALRQLEAEGLVVLRPHSGARVAMLDFDECLEIYKIRERLEPLAFSESIGRLTEEQLASVDQAARELEALTHDLKAWLEGDRRFHLATYAGISNGRLLRLIVGYWNISQQYRRILLTTFSANDFDLAHSEHRLMVDALVTGNARIGEELVRIAMERSRMRLSRNRHLFDR